MAKKASLFRFPFSNPTQLKKIQKKLFDPKKNKNGGKKFKWNWKRIGLYSLYIVGVFVLLLVLLFAWFAKDLPTPAKIAAITQSGSTRLYDRNGNELYTISGNEHRILVDSNQIPDTVKQATISLEDHNFYNNRGVDIRGIIRSIVIDLFSRQKAQGASTITQQYVRLAILNDTSKNYIRKLKEVILAIEVDSMYSKDQILTMYLNEIPYGGSNYGIEAAAESYYGKHAKDLTLSQAATLASLPQQPSTLSPYGTHTDALLARRNTDLDYMAQFGYITQAQADTAKKDPLGVVPESQSITAPHFVLYVKQWLVDYFTQQLGDATLAEQKVESGGLVVTTTLDLDKQKMAEAAVANNINTTLKRAGANDAGLVTIDPKTGEVIAMVGSPNYNQGDYGAFNTATAVHQPGSSFKPIVYATGFKGKYNPAYTLFDLKTDFGGGYVPQNYDGHFRGPISIRAALGNSLNIPAVKIAALAGIDNVIKTANDLGITSIDASKNYGLSLALGSGEVSPLQMAGAYGVFANNGTLVATTPVLKITDSKGKVMYDHSTPEARAGKQVLDPQIAYEIADMLSDINAKKPEFANVLGVLSLTGRPSGTKTGTTDDYRDAWTVGFTTDYVTAVWAGNNDHRPMTNFSIGAIAAAPIWHDAMVAYEKGLPVTGFIKPSSIQTVTVDKLSNKLPAPGSQTTSDIFATWQVPKDQDNVHQQIRVCKENGFLADSSIPDALTNTITVNTIHSEMPDNPNWEKPVQAWAAANGYGQSAPTQKCTADNSSTPSISITSPSNGTVETGPFTVTADANAPSGVKSVEFFIDGTSIGVSSSAPYQASYDASTLSAGSHTVSATITSTNGSNATDSIQVTAASAKDTTPPGNVSSFNGTAQGGGKAALTWTNPTDSDLKEVKIYIYNNATNALITTVEVPAPAHSTTITGLSAGSLRFTAKSVDNSGNESSGVSITLIVT